MVLRICSAYKTVSYETSLVVARILPIELLAKEREEVFDGSNQTEAKNRLWEGWQERWEATAKARWTRLLECNIRNCVERKHGEINYYLTQGLTGHGCFTEYLYDIGKFQSRECPYCGEVDAIGHTLFRCPRWEETRRQATLTADGSILRVSERAMVEDVLDSPEKMEVIERMIGGIMSVKEREVRELAHFP